MGFLSLVPMTRYAYRIVGCSSAQAPFLSLSFFLSIPIRVLLVASTYPLDWGCPRKEYRNLILKILTLVLVVVRVELHLIV